jgi:hypothetical protein
VDGGLAVDHGAWRGRVGADWVGGDAVSGIVLSTRLRALQRAGRLVGKMRNI